MGVVGFVAAMLNWKGSNSKNCWQRSCSLEDLLEKIKRTHQIERPSLKLIANAPLKSIGLEDGPFPLGLDILGLFSKAGDFQLHQATDQRTHLKDHPRTCFSGDLSLGPPIYKPLKRPFNERGITSPHLGGLVTSHGFKHHFRRSWDDPPKKRPLKQRFWTSHWWERLEKLQHAFTTCRGCPVAGLWTPWEAGWLVTFALWHGGNVCLGRFFVDKCFKHYHEDAEIWNMIILHDFPFGVMSGFQLFVFEVIFRSISLTLRKHGTKLSV